MSPRPFALTVLDETFAVCRLPSGAPPPDGIDGGPFVSVTRTGDELSIVCPESAAPEGAVVEHGWRCLRVAGPLDLGETGILASLLLPLDRAEIAVFALSTYDTDYLLVRGRNLEAAERALREEGHRVTSPSRVLPP
jgi:uncharacterized protein